jgi:predicted XRE-type DNA-binding protein
LKNSDELFARAQIGLEVLKILKDRKLKQHKAAGLLGVRQSEVSYLMRGQFHRFSEGKLLGFLKKLDRELILVINEPDHRHGVALAL